MNIIFDYVHGTMLVATNDAERNLTMAVKRTIDNVLLARTYWESNVLGKTSTDDYCATDAREFLQCAFVCAKQDLYQEALWWYRRADMLFMGACHDAVIATEKIQLTSSNCGLWEVAVISKVVTDYGNVDGFQRVADVYEHDMSVMRSIERQEELRWGTGGWFELIEAERDTRKANAQALEELRESMKYDN